MKLIIDIPEEAYKTIMNTSFVRDVDLTFKQSAKDIEQTNAIFSLIDALDNGTPIPDNATVCAEPTFDWLQNRVALAKAEINNAIESTFCTKDEAIGLGVALNVIDKYFTI